jgi:hypothetical protein
MRTYKWSSFSTDFRETEPNLTIEKDHHIAVMNAIRVQEESKELWTMVQAWVSLSKTLAPWAAIVVFSAVSKPSGL